VITNGQPSSLDALLFAARAHKDQRRKGTGEPYVNHLIEVAALLVRIGGVDDASVLSAAVLHDVIEDTAVTADEVERAFGARVRALVEAVTDDGRLPKAERKRLQIEHMRHAETDARLIKLADHCSNVATLPADWSAARRHEYLDWSAAVVRACAGTHAGLEQEHATRLERARREIA
jgi:GTP diphosphokinase / guanosine-3',5'-bis(diphosphate) 3'-diphosphatase